MVLAGPPAGSGQGKVLFVAGPAADAGGRPEGRDGGRGGLLMAVSASDGRPLAQHRLGAPPVFDGMAAAGGRLYIALENGQLVCMDAKGSE
jgi:hypothetical protein